MFITNIPDLNLLKLKAREMGIDIEAELTKILKEELIKEFSRRWYNLQMFIKVTK